MSAPRSSRALRGLTALAAVLAACGSEFGGPVSSEGETGREDRPPEVEPPRDCGPGRTVLRRLNRVEYDATARALLGEVGAPAADFPGDETAEGFDVVSEALSLSPLLFDNLERAAEQLARAAVVAEPVEPVRRLYEAEELSGTTGTSADGAWFLQPGGTLTLVFEAAATGRYELSFRAFLDYGLGGSEDPLEIDLVVDDDAPVVFPFDADPVEARTFRIERTLAAGPHRVELRSRATGAPRALAVDWIAADGPHDAEPVVPAAYDRVVRCDPAEDGRDACLASTLGQFAAKAWRRPVADEEVAELVALSDLVREDGGSFDEQVALALQAILLSPHFVFRVELGVEAEDGSLRLSDHELATRLSYFLWREPPDDELRALADAGRLGAELGAQVERMLSDPRAGAFVSDFVGQWLRVRALEDVAPDPERYPGWDDALRSSMRSETEAVFAELLASGRSALELVDATYTYADARLAEHYGLPGVFGEDVERVELGGGRQRGGILTHGSVLTVTSSPRRTSPVRRGAFVLESLLCSPPPPPPPGVEGLPEPVNPQGTLRERFEQHRSREECRSCHSVIDPIGFALENFDGIGAWRTLDDGYPVDASTEMLDGTRINGPFQLSAYIAEDPRLPACMVEKLAIFALGRALTPRDACAIEAIEDDFERSGYALPALVRSIVESEAFTRLETAEGQP